MTSPPSSKRVLLLGSGFVAAPAAEYIARRGTLLTIACRTLSASRSLASSISSATPIAFDVASSSSFDLDALLAQHDLVVSLVPPSLHTTVIESAIRTKIHVVTTSYVTQAMKDLDEKAKGAGIVVFNEIGVDPGIDHLWAIKTIDEVHQEGGKIVEFQSHCGSIPAPECANNALGYKFAWSPRGSILAMENSARYLKDGKVVEVEGSDLMKVAQPHIINSTSFVAFPNRDSTPFIESYAIPEAQTCVRWTLRYPGFPEMLVAWKEMGFFDLSQKEELATDSKTELNWAEFTANTIDAEEATEESIVASLLLLPSFQDPTLANDLLTKMRQLEFFSLSKVNKRGTTFDTLCSYLEQQLPYLPGERDRITLQHRFVVERRDGKKETRLSTLEMYGSSTGGPSAMATLVGTPCGIAVHQIFCGVLSKTGIQQPYDEETCAMFRAELAKEGIAMVETVM